MMTKENAQLYTAVSDEETIYRLAKECISKIDAAGGAAAAAGGVERVAKLMLKMIRKQKQKQLAEKADK